MKKINYGWHYIDSEDKNIILRSINNQNLLTAGKYQKKLEQKLSRYLNCKYALACNSATGGIHLSCLAINLKKGDNVIIPTVNFIAAASICSQMGANVFFADIDTSTGQMSPQNLIDCIKKNNIKKIKLFFTMYLGGSAKNIVEFQKIKKKLNCFLIEDACHAFGANYSQKNISKKVGCSYYSDLSVFSFHPVKTITSGEGGAISTNNKKLFLRIQNLRSHGIKRKLWGKTKNSFDYDIKNLSYNFRLSEINCALAFSQLKKLKKFISQRRKIAKIYIQSFKKYEKYINVLNKDDIQNSAWHLMILSFRNFNFKKDELIKLFLDNGIVIQNHYRPSHTFTYFKKMNFKLKNSMSYFNNSLSIPIFYSLQKKDIIKIVNIVLKYTNKKIQLKK